MARRRRRPPDEPDDLVEVPEEVNPGEGRDAAEARRLKRILVQLWLRENEALRLYRPLPHIDEKFHRSRATERLLRGSNRAGKSLGAAAEVARAVTNQDPHGKYPSEGLAYAVGFDEEHIARVMWPMLAAPNQFRIITDRDTGQWRSFDPYRDKGREAETKPAPALIPPRLIKSIAWSEKKRGIPKAVKLTTGWEIAFYSSKALPQQGAKIDLWWIDEECVSEKWYPELVMRGMDRKARGIWSATPLVANAQLYELGSRAAEGDPDVAECVCLVQDNPYIDPEETAKRAKSLTPEEYRVRILGEYLASGLVVYPEFSMEIHGFDATGWQVPEDWARFLVVDPGRQVCAVLFAAVPPPKPAEPYQVWFYDELYLRQCNAVTFGREVGQKSGGVVYEAMLIDQHAARVHDMGSGLTVEMQYREALKTNGVECRQSGHSFAWGNDDQKAGILAFRSWLLPRPDAPPVLKVARKMVAFKREAERYQYKRDAKTGLPTDEVNKKDDHLMDCARYLAQFKPRWYKPKKRKPPKSYAVRALERKRKRQRQREAYQP
jgi:hypothetical protein